MEQIIIGLFGLILGLVGLILAMILFFERRRRADVAAILQAMRAARIESQKRQGNYHGKESVKSETDSKPKSEQHETMPRQTTRLCGKN